MLHPNLTCESRPLTRVASHRCVRTRPSRTVPLRTCATTAATTSPVGRRLRSHPLPVHACVVTLSSGRSSRYARKRTFWISSSQSVRFERASSRLVVAGNMAHRVISSAAFSSATSTLISLLHAVATARRTRHSSAVERATSPPPEPPPRTAGCAACRPRTGARRRPTANTGSQTSPRSSPAARSHRRRRTHARPRSRTSCRCRCAAC